MGLADQLEEAVGLRADSKRALDAFISRKPYSGDLLDTDGKSLRQGGMGSQKLAVWRADGMKVHFVGDHSGRFQDQVIRYLKKNLAKGQLVFDYEVKFHSGGDVNGHQWDGWILAVLDGKVVGRLDWREYDGKYSIKFVEVDPEYRRTGIATQLYRELFRTQKISARDLGGSMMTPDGSAFRASARL